MLKHYYDEEREQHVIFDDIDGHEVRAFNSEDYDEGMTWYSENRMLGTEFHKLEQLIEAVNAEMQRLSDESPEEKDALGYIEFPHTIRWKLHVAACSIRDFTFWVYKCTDDGTYYRAYEVETGIHYDGVTPREAIERYFKSDVLDLPRSGE